MNYTKGEWKAKRGHPSTNFTIFVEHGDKMIGEIKIPDIETIALLYPPDNMPFDKGDVAEEANAHLISAAPDMYEACKEMLEELKITKGAAGIWLVRWAKALAKAEGGKK